MFCQARARSSSLTMWQASASPSAVQPTSVRWSKKTLTACQKAPRAPRVRQAPAATRIQSVPNPSSIPSKSVQPINFGVSYRRQTSKSWITT